VFAEVIALAPSLGQSARALTDIAMANVDWSFYAKFCNAQLCTRLEDRSWLELVQLANSPAMLVSTCMLMLIGWWTGKDGQLNDYRRMHLCRRPGLEEDRCLTPVWCSTLCIAEQSKVPYALATSPASDGEPGAASCAAAAGSNVRVHPAPIGAIELAAVHMSQTPPQPFHGAAVAAPPPNSVNVRKCCTDCGRSLQGRFCTQCPPDQERWA
jgi:hypothetical protein